MSQVVKKIKRDIKTAIVVVYMQTSHLLSHTYFVTCIQDFVDLTCFSLAFTHDFAMIDVLKNIAMIIKENIKEMKTVSNIVNSVLIFI